jgi:diadenosine tetraphosphate (Ap4A) HIT family hydrolase
VSFEQLWAGWRSGYVSSVAVGEAPAPVEDLESADELGLSASDAAACVFCRIIASREPDQVRHVVWSGERTIAILNAYPYSSGHMLIMPIRHIGELEDLDAGEAAELWSAVTDAVRALRTAYHPDGFNVGLNLGRAAGAGMPGHLHVHAVPRWAGDANFMTVSAAVRVIPESLADSWEKLHAAW